MSKEKEIRKVALTLKDLVSNKQWSMIEKSINKGLKPTKIFVSFKSRDKTSELVDRVLIKIGKEVMDDLKLKKGDRVNIFHHPDDFMAMMVTKSKTDHGYTVSIAPGDKFGYVCFKWNLPLILRPEKDIEVEHLITRDGSVVFRVNDNQ